MREYGNSVQNSGFSIGGLGQGVRALLPLLRQEAHQRRMGGVLQSIPRILEGHSDRKGLGREHGVPPLVHRVLLQVEHPTQKGSVGSATVSRLERGEVQPGDDIFKIVIARGGSCQDFCV